MEVECLCKFSVPGVALCWGLIKIRVFQIHDDIFSPIILRYLSNVCVGVNLNNHSAKQCFYLFKPGEFCDLIMLSCGLPSFISFKNSEGSTPVTFLKAEINVFRLLNPDSPAMVSSFLYIHSFFNSLSIEKMILYSLINSLKFIL